MMCFEDGRDISFSCLLLTFLRPSFFVCHATVSLKEDLDGIIFLNVLENVSQAVLELRYLKRMFVQDCNMSQATLYKIVLYNL
jgi:hypothetical protein